MQADETVEIWGAEEMTSFERAITPKLDAILADQAEQRTTSALIQQDLKAIRDNDLASIREHLRILNGRTAKSEDRIAALEHDQRVEAAVSAHQRKLMVIGIRILKYGGTAAATYFLAKYPELAKALAEAAK